MTLENILNEIELYGRLCIRKSYYDDRGYKCSVDAKTIEGAELTINGSGDKPKDAAQQCLMRIKEFESKVESKTLVLESKMLGEK